METETLPVEKLAAVSEAAETSAEANNLIAEPTAVPISGQNILENLITFL
jgi:hypothetical protein